MTCEVAADQPLQGISHLSGPDVVKEPESDE